MVVVTVTKKYRVELADEVVEEFGPDRLELLLASATGFYETGFRRPFEVAGIKVEPHSTTIDHNDPGDF